MSITILYESEFYLSGILIDSVSKPMHRPIPMVKIFPHWLCCLSCTCCYFSTCITSSSLLWRHIFFLSWAVEAKI